jgi:hypothetical protein
LLVAVIAVGLVVTITGVVPTIAACAEVSSLAKHPTDPVFMGAPLGPLLASEFAGNARQAVITTYQDGFATPVLIVAARPYDRMLTLRGWHCIDHRTLRIDWQYPFTPGSRPAPHEAFATAGHESMALPRFATLPEAGVVGPGTYWFLFDSPGRWVLEVSDGAELLGQATLDVRVGTP